MPAPGSAPNRSFRPVPVGKKPPPALKFALWNFVNRMMMVRTGIATFHQVTALKSGP